MNEVLAALEQDGLIVRSPAANHGSVVELALSDRGDEVLAACDRAVTAHGERHARGPRRRRAAQQLREALIGCVHRLGAGFGPR